MRAFDRSEISFLANLRHLALEEGRLRVTIDQLDGAFGDFAFEDFFRVWVAQGALNLVRRVLCHLTEQPLELPLHSCEDLRDRALFDHVVVLQLALGLDFLLRKSVAALRT